MRHTISVLVQNKFGVLTRVAGLFSGRGFNIDSLNVAPTHDPSMSRMTIVTRGDDTTLDQIVKQLNKLVDSLEVQDFRDGEYVDRELVLVRVGVDPQSRAEVMQITDIFRAKIVDVQPASVTIEIDNNPIAEIEDVLATIEDPQQTIWDVRSAEEYFGLRQAAARVGHIPGAVNLDWERLKDPERHMRLRTDLEEVLAGLGLNDDKVIITHCQSHHRSGLSYMVGRLLGLNIRAYHGSWSEWGASDAPIE